MKKISAPKRTIGREIKINIIAATFAVLGIVGLIITCLFTEAVSEKAESTRVFDVEKSDIISIHTEYDNQSFDLRLDGDKFIYTADEEYILDEQKVDKMLDCLSNMRYEKKVDYSVTDTEKYGIDFPLLKISFSTEGGQYECDIGDFNRQTELYYMMDSLDDTLYFVDDSVVKLFGVDILDLIADDNLPKIDTADFVSVIIRHSDESLPIQRENAQYFIGLKNGKSICDEKKIVELYQNLNELQLKCVMTNVNTSDRKKFKLSENLYEYIYTYLVGDDDAKRRREVKFDILQKDDKCYMMVDGGNNIYELEEKDVPTFTPNLPDDLLSKKIISIKSGEIKKISITLDTGTYNIDAESELNDKEGTVKIINSFTCDDVKCDLFDVFSDLNALEKIDRPISTADGELLLALFVEYRDKSTTEIRFIRGDDKYSTVNINNDAAFSVETGDIEKIAQKIKKELPNGGSFNDKIFEP